MGLDPAPSLRRPARRRSRLRAAIALIGAALLGAPLASHGGELPPEAPWMVVDLHVDIPWQVHFKHRATDLHEGHARLDTLSAGNYGGLVFPIYLPDKPPLKNRKNGSLIEDADAVFASIEAIIARDPLFLPLGSSRAQPGKISTFLAIEGAGAFGADITQIDRFIARGLRLVSPAHRKNSPLSASATGEKVKYGLTPLGKDFCARVYEKGALIDVSHVSDAAFLDILAIAEAHHAPVVATHSNSRALADSPRNLTDAQLAIIGRTGGVAGLNLHSPFVSGKADATIDDVIAQVEHMVKIAGVDHVALGTDFDGDITPPAGLEDASTLPVLARALRRRGLSYEEVLKIFSLNALRILGWMPPPREVPDAGPAGRETLDAGVHD
ncbi:MAG: membrane dipeptidase [Minicystis sp.]